MKLHPNGLIAQQSTLEENLDWLLQILINYQRLLILSYLSQPSIQSKKKVGKPFTFGKNRNLELICHPADGETLKSTPSSSCQLVHAHAVIVYLPFLKSFSYLREAARVLVSGGHLFSIVYWIPH
jgi:hypothetical protein